MRIDWGKTLTSKTVWLGILTILLGVVEYIIALPVGASIGTIIVGVLGIVIRFLTTESITKENTNAE